MPLQLEFKIDNAGLEKLAAKISQTGRTSLQESGVTLFDHGVEIMQESLAEIPVDTGTAQSTGFVDVPEVKGPGGGGEDGKVMVRFGYASPRYDKLNPKSYKMASEYIVYLHERLDVRHAQGKAKFLEDPINRHREALKQVLVNRLGAALRGAGVGTPFTYQARFPWRSSMITAGSVRGLGKAKTRTVRLPRRGGKGL